MLLRARLRERVITCKTVNRFQTNEPKKGRRINRRSRIRGPPFWTYVNLADDMYIVFALKLFRKYGLFTS